MKSTYYRYANLHILFIALWIGSVIVLVGLILWVRYSSFPTQPVSKGDFPSQPVWVFEADQKVVATPVYYENIVIVRTERLLYAVEVNTGLEIWRRVSNNESGISLAPKADDGVLFVPEDGASLSAYLIRSGERLWQTHYSSEGIENPSLLRFETLDISTNIILVGRSDHGLTAYNRFTGERIWFVPGFGRQVLYTAIDSGIVYLAAGRSLYAYAEETGKLLWRKDFDIAIGPILVDETSIYIAQNSAVTLLTAWDKASGAEKWKLESAAVGEYDPDYLTKVGDALIISGSCLAKIAMETGRIGWVIHDLEHLRSAAYVNDMIFVRNRENLYGIDWITGQLKNDLRLRFSMDLNLIATGDLLIFPFGDNRIFAYQP